MDNLAFWMAEQICSLLPHLGLHACGAAADQYLIGVAGWIFGGIILLVLMGISDEIERRKAARRTHAVSKSPNAVALIEEASDQHEPGSEGVADLGSGRPTSIRVRSIRSRRHRIDQGAYVSKPMRSTNVGAAGSSGT